MPTELGLYKYRCMETDYYWYYAAIIKDERGIICVCEEDLGRIPLEDFHNNLTYIEWIKEA